MADGGLFLGTHHFHLQLNRIMQVRYQTWRLYGNRGWRPTIHKFRELSKQDLEFLSSFTRIPRENVGRVNLNQSTLVQDQEPAVDSQV